MSKKNPTKHAGVVRCGHRHHLFEWNLFWSWL